MLLPVPGACALDTSASNRPRAPTAWQYWNIKQQLVHHTVTGCNMQPGDLCGSGTISGATDDSCGSMLELCWQGTKPLTLPGG